MRVIVCGGRDLNDRFYVYESLDRFHRVHGVTCVIQGGAKGADKLAYEWAADRMIMVINEPADWKQHGRAAGPMRNQKMIDDHRPDAVIAFEGGSGTADMIRRSKRAGLTVFRPTACI